MNQEGEVTWDFSLVFVVNKVGLKSISRVFIAFAEILFLWMLDF